MFSVLKMVKKGAVALGCFAGPAILGILFKLIPGMNSITVGEVIINVFDKIMPDISTLTIGTGLIMLINWLKNRN